MTRFTFYGFKNKVPICLKNVRTLTKPSSAHCDLNLYVRYLLACPRGNGCNQMAQILGHISHDSINRFLTRECYSPKDMFDFLVSTGQLQLLGGVLSADDTLIEKPYSNLKACDLIGYYWSSKAGKPMLGIPLITLYYTCANGFRVPVNYRIYDQNDGKTKNEYLREMIEEVRQWGLKAIAFTSDSWYASKDNLNLVKNAQMGFVVGVAKNRQVRVAKVAPYERVDGLNIPTEGLKVYLKGVGIVKVFCQQFKNGSRRYYILHVPESQKLDRSTQAEFKKLHSIHWGIENYHRASKQLCGLQRFRVRKTEAIKTHVFCALRGFIELEIQVRKQLMSNWYSLQKTLYYQTARKFIVQESISDWNQEYSHLSNSVNA